MRIGILREERTPPDFRVPLLPAQCRSIVQQYPHVSFCIQPSSHRCVQDEAYAEAGVAVHEDISNCAVLLGVKEVPVFRLIPRKTYFFFSHTAKQQPHNRGLLRAVLENKITLIDYECLTDNSTPPERIISFGRHAGIIGAYNAFWMYGNKYGAYQLKRACACANLEEVQREYAKVTLGPIKILLTGKGRVGRGAIEVLEGLNVRRVSPADYLRTDYDVAVYTALDSADYHVHQHGLAWNTDDFHRQPGNYRSTFLRYVYNTDMLIATAYWNPQGPVLFALRDLQDEKARIRIIADVTCDLAGSIPCTLRTTTISDPVYDFNPFTYAIERAFSSPGHVSVMAIDNLPSELPWDASAAFGQQFSEQIMPNLVGGPYGNPVLERATIARDGRLTGRYQYLERSLAERV